MRRRPRMPKLPSGEGGRSYCTTAEACNSLVSICRKVDGFLHSTYMVTVRRQILLSSSLVSVYGPELFAPTYD